MKQISLTRIYSNDISKMSHSFNNASLSSQNSWVKSSYNVSTELSGYLKKIFHFEIKKQAYT